MVNGVKQHLNSIGAEKKKGLDETLTYIKENHLLTGIASGSSKNTIVQILNKAGIDEKLFSSYVTADLDVKSKPSPDAFIKSCENLGVKPEEAIVLEDSYNGVKAGRSAGCFTIMIPELCLQMKK